MARTARKKLIIEARINEYMMRDDNPNVPWTPDEIAAMVRHLCLPGGAYITGQTIHVNGGMYLA